MKADSDLTHKRAHGRLTSKIKQKEKEGKQTLDNQDLPSLCHLS